MGIGAAVGSRKGRLAELTEALRRPPSADRMRDGALAGSDRRAAAVLDGEPWKDPASRNAILIAIDMHEVRMARVRQADRRVEDALAEVRAARGRIGFLDRLAGTLGVRTASVRDLDEAVARAVLAGSARDGCCHGLREELGGIDRHARAIVRGREAERAAWSGQPDVTAARRELHGNDLVRMATAGGDCRIGHLAAADLQAARKTVLDQEAGQIRPPFPQGVFKQHQNARPTSAKGILTPRAILDEWPSPLKSMRTP